MILIQPVQTEKSLKELELNRTIMFVVNINATKEQIKKEFQKLYNIKPLKINTHIRNGKKYAFIKVPEDVNIVSLAHDLGMQV